MKFLIPLLCAILSASIAHADDALPPTLLTQRGKLLMSEDFQKPIPSLQAGKAYKDKKGWRLLSGQWDFIPAGLKGTELKDGGRSAFIVYNVPFKSAVIQFDVRLDGCRQVIFRIQDAKPEHICSVRRSYDGFAAQKDDHDHAGPDTAVPFGRAALPVKPGEWQTVVVEILGDEMVTTIGNKTVAGKHPLIAAEKATIEFVVTGESATFRNVRMWEAQANPAWAETRERLRSK